MRKILSLAAIILCSLTIRAQEVPQKIQDAYVKLVTESGEVLEKSVLPDFSRPHPTKLYSVLTCFPGKKIMVRVLTAVKPGDLKLKVNVGSQEVEPKTDYTILTLGGNNYWSRTMALDMRAMTNTSESCMEIYAYDMSNIDLPVYLYFFSYK